MNITVDLYLIAATKIVRLGIVITHHVVQVSSYMSTLIDHNFAEISSKSQECIR